uniref:Uncharacterized protein n=1 Tax=Arundo donax TaxID=35708 RepID=A0A0A9DDU8_ARUDO
MVVFLSFQLLMAPCHKQRSIFFLPDRFKILVYFLISNAYFPCCLCTSDQINMCSVFRLVYLHLCAS